MINDDIIAIKESILNTVGENCEKLILFGSHAYGTPREGSDYDFFVVLRDDSEKPILALQQIYRSLARKPMPVSVDVRYPNELVVDDVIAKSAIEKAQSIYDFCTEKVTKSLTARIAVNSFGNSVKVVIDFLRAEMILQGVISCCISCTH
jgi:predicted nucleotidyltransferase